jgi:hypothetical protein
VSTDSGFYSQNITDPIDNFVFEVHQYLQPLLFYFMLFFIILDFEFYFIVALDIWIVMVLVLAAYV